MPQHRMLRILIVPLLLQKSSQIPAGEIRLFENRLLSNNYLPLSSLFNLNFLVFHSSKNLKGRHGKAQKLGFWAECKLTATFCVSPFECIADRSFLHCLLWLGKLWNHSVYNFSATSRLTGAR